MSIPVKPLTTSHAPHGKESVFVGRKQDPIAETHKPSGLGNKNVRSRRPISGRLNIKKGMALGQRGCKPAGS